MKEALEMIRSERWRQFDQEGWTFAHDDTHRSGELAKAAACYAVAHTTALSEVRSIWPWRPADWKPSDDHIRDLVKAGALIVAEIERLQRAMLAPTPPPGDQA